MTQPHSFTALKTEGPNFNDSGAKPGPAVRVAIEDLAEYLRGRGEKIVGSYWTVQNVFVVLVAPKAAPISTDIAEEATPNATL